MAQKHSHGVKDNPKNQLGIKRTTYNSILEGIYLITRMGILLLATRLIMLKYGVIGFGYYSFWFSIVAYLNILIDFGVNLTGVREVGKLLSTKKYSDVSRFYYGAFIIRIIPAMLLGLMTIIGISLHIISIPEAAVLLTGIIMGILESTWFMQAFDEYTLRTLFNIGVRILFLITVYFIPASWNVLWILIIRNLSVILKDFFAFILIELKYKLRTLPQKLHICKFLKLTSHNFATLIFSAGYRQAYPIFLKFFLTPYAYGIFSAVYRILSLVGETQLVVTRPAFTLFSRKVKNKRFYKWGTYISTLAIILTSILALILAYNPIVMRIIYPKIVYDRVLLKLILGASIVGILWSISGHTNIIFMVLNHKDKILAKIMGIKVIITIIGILLLNYMNYLNIYTILLFVPLICAELVNIFINALEWYKEYETA